MLETIITIILVPIAICAVLFTGALLVGVYKYLKSKRK